MLSTSPNLLRLHVIETDVYLGFWLYRISQLSEKKEERTGNEESQTNADK